MSERSNRSPRQPPTLDDVARHSGVSRSTASRAVNGEPGVRPAIAERVRRAVDELGYVPNQAARRLVTRRNDAIAILVSEPQNHLFADPFFDRRLRGIRQELARQGVQPVLLLIEEPDDYRRVGTYLAGGHVDGALLFALRTDDPLPGMVDRLGLPAVVGGHPADSAEGGRGYVYVDADNRGGAREAVRHLRSLGRERVATITGPLDQPSAADRLAGYRDVLLESPPGLIAQGDFSQQGGREAMAALLDRCPDLDAVFAASDLMAAGALQVLRERGRTVPEDVAVVGFDDLPVAEQTDPPLTTVHQDIEEMGRLMARLLFSRTSGTPGPGEGGYPLTSVITPTRLVLRKSA